MESLTSSWVKATSAGWLVGILLIVVLALIGEAFGIGGAQVLVGVGMGAGIGVMQGRVIRSIGADRAAWFWSCVLGLGAPFLAADLAAVARLNVPYWLPVSVAVGGLAAGAGQALILRSRFELTLLWVAASVVGWTLAAGTTAAADALFRSRSLRGILGALSYLGVIAAGGPLLGLVSAAAFSSMRRRDTVAR
jgi:hypothetical protein